MRHGMKPEETIENNREGTTKAYSRHEISLFRFLVMLVAYEARKPTLCIDQFWGNPHNKLTVCLKKSLSYS
jgi:hypothetical protein